MPIEGAEIIQFEVSDRALLSRLKVHDPVVPDFNTWRVAVLSGPSKLGPAQVVKPGGSSNNPGNLPAGDPKIKPDDPRGPAATLRCGDEDFSFCCAITSIGIQR